MARTERSCDGAHRSSLIVTNKIDEIMRFMRDWKNLRSRRVK